MGPILTAPEPTLGSIYIVKVTGIPMYYSRQLIARLAAEIDLAYKDVDLIDLISLRG